MRTKTNKRNRVNVITLGCSKNTYDSEVIMGQLRASDIEVEHEAKPRDSDIIIVNTCGFIDNAKQESIDTILHFAREKEKGKIEKLIVTGCLSERYMPELKKEIPNVDHYFGTRDLPLLLNTLGADYRHELVGERLITTPRHYAYLKISEGCDRPCSFCAIPLMRGKHISRPMDSLVEEAGKLAAAGTRELILIAQDSTYYGIDLYGKRTLSELIKRLADVEGIEWIRLHYAFPSGFPDDVLDVIRDTPSVCNYLDIPIQHISNSMLSSMRRGSTAEQIYSLIDKIRDRVPGIAIRTTLISGYPGETMKDHEELLDFVRKVRFHRLGVFEYSHEEQTHAFSLKDDVPAELKTERVQSIMALQQSISAQMNDQLVGSRMNIIIDRKEGPYFIGRTEFDSPEVDNEVLIEAEKHYLRIGNFAPVQITGAGEFDLFAIPIQDS